jgi:hypothetical protein
MSSIKCPTCGLTNFGKALTCKRCNQPLGKEQAGMRAAVARSKRVASDRNDAADEPTQRKYGKTIAGALIVLALVFGLATALTQNYYYLAIAAPALLVGAFITVRARSTQSQAE